MNIWKSHAILHIYIHHKVKATNHRHSSLFRPFTHAAAQTSNESNTRPKVEENPLKETQSETKWNKLHQIA